MKFLRTEDVSVLRAKSLQLPNFLNFKLRGHRVPPGTGKFFNLSALFSFPHRHSFIKNKASADKTAPLCRDLEFSVVPPHAGQLPHEKQCRILGRWDVRIKREKFRFLLLPSSPWSSSRFTHFLSFLPPIEPTLRISPRSVDIGEEVVDPISEFTSATRISLSINSSAAAKLSFSRQVPAIFTSGILANTKLVAFSFFLY